MNTNDYIAFNQAVNVLSLFYRVRKMPLYVPDRKNGWSLENSFFRSAV